MIDMKFSAFILTTVLVLATAAAASTDREIIVSVDAVPLAWGDSRVAAKLQRYLSRDGNLSVSLAGEDDSGRPAFPADRYNIDSLMNWGREVGGRYLMLVDVTAERLERRKSFHVPLVFHKYQTVGIIEGEFRLLDLTRGRVLTAEPFQMERKGPRIFQGTMDDDINDPDLHLTASRKVVFFDELETGLCRRLAEKVGHLVGRR